MVIIMMAVSTIWGFTFVFLTSQPDVQNSLLFKYGLSVLDLNVWGIALLAGGLMSLVGFIAGWDEITKIGAFLGFMAWAFACFTYIQHHFWFALAVTGLFHLLFQGYVYLATALGFLRRRPV